MGVLGGGWTMESGGGQGRGGWIKESVNLVSVGGWVCVGVLSVGLGPGLDSMSPARSRRSASHAAGTHGWLPKKTGRVGLPLHNIHIPFPFNSIMDIFFVDLNHGHLLCRSQSWTSSLSISIMDIFFVDLKSLYTS